MRMWLGVEPSELCRQHLLGEHREIGGIVYALRQIEQGNQTRRWFNKLMGHIRAGQIDMGVLRERHDALAEEIVNRGYQHNSILSDIPEWIFKNGSVPPWESRVILAVRCQECSERMSGKTAK